MLSKLPIPAAKAILEMNLPEREWKAIYLHDVEQRDLFSIADELGCTDSNIKKIRKHGYEKLAVLYFSQK